MSIILIDILFAILGWVCGALVNYLADVLPWRRRLVAPFCQKCEAPIPLLNYLLWPRRCPVCQHPRRWRTWLVEIIGILATLWLWNFPPPKLGFILGLVVLLFFAVVVIIDLEYRLIMHPVSIAGAVLGLVVGVILHGWLKTLLGGVIGFGVMFLFYFLGTLFARWMARRRGENLDGEALGFGDVNLSGVLGLMLGSSLILVGLFLGVIIGAVISLLYMLGMILARKYKMFAAIPYGPFLITGAFILIYLGNFLKLILGTN